MKKKIIATLLASVMVVSLGVTGCGKSKEDSKESAEGGNIKIGYIQDLTGDYAVAGNLKLQGAKFAVDELNEKGGIDGKKVELITYDSASDTAKSEEGAKQLYLNDNVDVIVGGYSSPSHEAIRTVAEQYNKIYFYDNVYEGGVFSHNFFDVALSETQIESIVNYMVNKFGKKVYCLYADYNWGQISDQWVEYYAKKAGATMVGSEARPFGTTDFTDVIADIQKKKPDFIITEVSGSAMNAFFEQISSAGLDIPMGSTINLINGEHISIGKETMNNMYTTTSYAEEVDNKENKELIEKWKKKYETAYIGSDAFTAYASIMIYAAAVEKSKTTEVEAVIDALEDNIKIETPVGDISIDPKSHHGIANQYVVMCDKNAEGSGLKLLEKLEPVNPSEEGIAALLNMDVTKMENGDPKTKAYTPDDIK